MPAKPFIPGNSPCGELCTLPWAAAQLGIPSDLLENPLSLTLEPGTTITWMSYGRDGAPHGYHTNLFTVAEHVVVAHQLPGGNWLVQFWECGNWAVIHVPPTVEGGGVTVHGVAYTPTPTTPTAGGSTPHHWVPTPWVPSVPVVPAPPPPAPIPLMGGGWMLLLALATLLIIPTRRKP